MSILQKLFGINVRESANDGSDFSNPDTDYRVLFLGEDGQLHVKDSAGTVTDIGAAVAGAAAAHGCRATRASGNVSLGSNTLTAIPFTQEDFDTDTMHDNSTNPSRFTIPSISGVTTGLWVIAASGYTDGTSAAGCDSELRVNAAGNPTSGTSIAFGRFSQVTGLTSVIVSTAYVFSAGDYVEWFVRVVGASGNLTFDAAGSPILTIGFLGKVT